MKAAALLLMVIAASAPSAHAAPKLPVVKLLDAGSGPKHKLRLHAVAGAKRTLVMKMTMAMEIDGGPMMRIPHTDLPVMKMTMDTKVTDVDKTGKATYQLVVTAIDVERGNATEAMVTSVKASLAKLKGMKGTATVDERNFTIAGSFDVPAGADANVKQMLDSMSQSISQLSTPLPDEAVGVGAKWSVAAQMPANGIVLSQVGQFEITKLEGDHVNATVTINQTAAKQTAHPPNMGGGSLTVVSWKGKGAGEIELDLAKEILPVRGKISVSENAKFTIDAGGQTQDMTMGMDLGMEL